MKNRLLAFLIPAALAMFMSLYSPSAMAQQSGSGPDVGQQGENVGDHVDTGAAALDSGPELKEGTDLNEQMESDTVIALAPVNAATTVVPAGVSAATSSGSTQDINVEGDFDLQEIAGTDVPGAN